MKIGFTGSRYGMSQHQKEQFVVKMLDLNPTEFHHGDCEGADAEAHDIVRAFFPNVKIVIHPPESHYMRAFKDGDEMRLEFGYLIRDRHIVDDTEYLIGAPLSADPDGKSGSWYTIKYSIKKNKPNTVLARSTKGYNE